MCPGFAECIMQVVLLKILRLKWSEKKHFVPKILVTIWDRFL